MSRHVSAEEQTEQLRAQVEQTRDRLGDTVEALAAKADVKARVRQKAHQVRGRATWTRQRVRGRVQDTAPAPLRRTAGHAGALTRGKRAPVLVAGAAGAALVTVLVVRYGLPLPERAAAVRTAVRTRGARTVLRGRTVLRPRTQARRRWDRLRSWA